MAYDDEFFKMYVEYLQEPTVRANHDAAFRLFRTFCGDVYHNVIDLGCGSYEFVCYGSGVMKYCGVDKTLRGSIGRHIEAVEYDYLAPDVMNVPSLLRADHRFSPNTFVSLFSVEPIIHEEQRYAFYTNLFETCPTLKYGLSAGFYYTSLSNQATVGETGGIISHQTIDRPYEYPHPLFTETRILMETPSKMFGKDVVEVYKMMKRV
jgi:hypothetical protein